MTALPYMIEGKPPNEPAGVYSPLSLARLVNRVTFGVTPAELSLAQSLGRDAYIELHLHPEQIPDAVVKQRIDTDYRWLNLSAPQLTGFTADQLINWLVDARILRASMSTRQLFERIVEMWTDHFNIYIRTGPLPVMKIIHDRDVIRAHALGRFHDLLVASAQCPAMLFYLDNRANQFGNPNENFARELMELHCMGPDGGFTQQDVQEVARCFTGWGHHGGFEGPLAYTFQFNANGHDQGSKLVLGHVIPANGGIEDGFRVLQILADHPSTAQHIARKLLTEFWGYDPPARLVGDVARIYQRTGGDIRAMVRAILALHIWPSPTPKLKRPLHLVCSALRAIDASLPSPGAMRLPLAAAGHLPFHWAPPNGYPDRLSAWAGSLLARWNFATDLAGDAFGPDAPFSLAPLGAGLPAGAAADAIAYRLHAGEMPETERRTLLEWLGPAPIAETRLREALGLALSMPAFQWY